MWALPDLCMGDEEIYVGSAHANYSKKMRRYTLAARETCLLEGIIILPLP
jgi:hypothetical protein